MADKETTKLIVEAVEYYVGVQRNQLKPDASIDTIKRVVRFTELLQALQARKDE